MSRTDRPAVDRLLVSLLFVLRAGLRLSPRIGRRCLAALCALAATLTWPLSSVRRRAADAGVPLSPLRWGWSVGRNLASLLGAPPPLSVEGFPRHPQRAVVLAGHQGPWEAGAVELARRGVRPLVIAAPWARLPRTEALVRECRAGSGVRSLPRGRAAMAEATRHLRDGGWVVVLVDSLNPARAGRRPAAFVAGSIGAPDGLVSWAARQGAAVLVATAAGSTFRVEELRPAGPPTRPSATAIRETANAVVAALRERTLERPAEWLWVRALATLALTTLAGCIPELPPLPLEPEPWLAEADGVRWAGTIEDAPATFSATAARGRHVDGAWVGGFEDVDLRWADDGREVRVQGRTAFGTFPGGPLTVTGAQVHVDGVGGEVDELRWTGRTITCGGCPLEDLLR